MEASLLCLPFKSLIKIKAKIKSSKLPTIKGLSVNFKAKYLSHPIQSKLVEE